MIGEHLSGGAADLDRPYVAAHDLSSRAAVSLTRCRGSRCEPGPESY